MPLWKAGRIQKRGRYVKRTKLTELKFSFIKQLVRSAAPCTVIIWEKNTKMKNPLHWIFVRSATTAARRKAAFKISNFITMPTISYRSSSTIINNCKGSLKEAEEQFNLETIGHITLKRLDSLTVLLFATYMNMNYLATVNDFTTHSYLIYKKQQFIPAPNIFYTFCAAFMIVYGVCL